jgi:hypothetical protein
VNIKDTRHKSVDWINMARDKVQRWAFMNSVTRCRVWEEGKECIEQPSSSSLLLLGY